MPTAKFHLAVVILVVSVLVTLIAETSAITCYECTGTATDPDKSCLDPFNSRSQTVQLRQCVEFGAGDYLCAKTVSESNVVATQSYHGTVYRGCHRVGISASPGRAALTTNTHLCDTNLCNSATGQFPINGCGRLLIFLATLLSVRIVT